MRRIELDHQKVQTTNVQMNKKASTIELALLIRPFGGNIDGRSGDSAILGYLLFDCNTAWFISTEKHAWNQAQ